MSESGSKGGKKRKSKSYYKKCGHKKMRKNSNLDVGMKGFLVTCNNNEKQAVRECYNILNEYADKLYGIEAEQNKPPTEIESESEEEDMEKAMQKEVESLKSPPSQAERRFQNHFTKAKNCIFIRTTLADPCELAHTILSDIASSKVQKTRFALRMLPVVETCRAIPAEIEKLAQKIFENYFRTPFGKGLNYSTLFKVRNNNGIGRESVVPMLGGIVKGLNPLHKVSYDNPDFVILVEILGNICCLSVVKDFYTLKKFNLIEVTKACPPLQQLKLPNIDVEADDKQKSEKPVNDSDDVSENSLNPDSHATICKAEYRASTECIVSKVTEPIKMEEKRTHAVSTGMGGSEGPRLNIVSTGVGNNEEITIDSDSTGMGSKEENMIEAVSSGMENKGENMADTAATGMGSNKENRTDFVSTGTELNEENKEYIEPSAKGSSEENRIDSISSTVIGSSEENG